jgi:hypothetical protein|tara:strand:+ start:558 stop:857 length:300 start_codon:yes stop_codon:yes gene_type:complete
MDLREKMRLEYKLKDQLDKQYKKVHVFGVGKDWNDSLYVSQGRKNRGMVIASVLESGIVDEKVRQLKKEEMQSIVDFFEYQAEPHDIGNFGKDVFSVEQ